MITNLLKIELKYYNEEEEIGTEASITEILKDLMDETNSHKELQIALDKIENILEDLMEEINNKMEEIENV